MREQAAPLAEAALRDRLSHRAYLAELLSAELDDRGARRREHRIAEACFPRLKHLADFDLEATPTVDPTQPTRNVVRTGAALGPQNARSISRRPSAACQSSREYVPV